MGTTWLFGLQSALAAESYVSEQAFEAMLEQNIAMPKAQTGAANEHWRAFEKSRGQDVPKLLVFPETTAAWLLFTVAGFSPLGHATVEQALGALAGHVAATRKGPYAEAVAEALENLKPKPNPTAQRYMLVPEADEMIKQSWQDRLMRALISCLGTDTLELMHRVCSRVAKRHGAWLVPGSLYAPAFEVDGLGGWSPRGDYSAETMYDEQKKLLRREVGTIRLPQVYNQAPLYGPDGKLVGVFPKCFPTEFEFAHGIMGASPREWNSVETPLGRLGVLVCADAWYPPCYYRAAQQGVQVMAVTSMGSNRRKWFEKWGGFSNFLGFIPMYDRAAEYELVKVRDRLGDPCRKAPITEEGAWTCFALSSRMVPSVPTATAGIDVFACGDLWDWECGGRSVVVWADQPIYRARASHSRVSSRIDVPGFLAVKLLESQICNPEDVYLHPPLAPPPPPKDETPSQPQQQAQQSQPPTQQYDEPVSVPQVNPN